MGCNMKQRVSTQQGTDVGGKLSFCSNCHVSISETEARNRTTRRTPAGNVWCTLCARAGSAERKRRRAVLEEEFADDAPIVEAPVVNPSPRSKHAATAATRPTGPTVDQRIGHLERTVFQLQARVQELEERLRSRAD
jgi:hypothetical protein